MIPTKQSITQASERIKPYIHHTPIMTSTSIDAMMGCQLFFKCENFQNVGAFKARGAMNAALSLSPNNLTKGLATHSSGNHAQAVARAAQILGVRSYIVMPHNVSLIKKKGVIAYGGEIFDCEPSMESRESALAEVIKNKGASEIHPFNNYDVIAGQATAAKEFFEDVSDLDFIVVPVGGGGLLSGTALATKYFSSQTIVIAGEPEGADDTFQSLQSGKLESSQADSIADGLLAGLGNKTFAIIYENVKEIITVSDKEIIDAMRLIWERMKIIIEPSSAVPFAAVLKTKDKFTNKKIGIILSGGNVDLETASKLFVL